MTIEAFIGWIRCVIRWWARTNPAADIVRCPEPTCQKWAQVLDRVDLPSTSGPVEHMATRCGNGHGFTLPRDRW